MRNCGGGLAEAVVCAGYRDGDYPAVLRWMDVLTLVVPGSDGTCRALLEGLASGVPAVVSRRGALPEIVANGTAGRIVEDRAANGPFASVDDLDRVHGIGPKTVERLRAFADAR